MRAFTNSTRSPRPTLGLSVDCAFFSVGGLLPPVNMLFSSAAQLASSEGWVDVLCCTTLGVVGHNDKVWAL